MKKSVLIGIIASIVAIGTIAGSVFLFRHKHTEVIDPAIVPTCESTGLTEGKHCSDCGEILIAQKVVYAMGHTDAIVKGKAPTCTEKGFTEGKECIFCGIMIVQPVAIGTIDCIESDWIVDLYATHTEDGKRHTECTMCGKIFKEEIFIAGQKLLEYTLLNNNTYAVSGIGLCKDKDIIIPSTYNDLPVTSIRVGAFSGCLSLKSIVIPDSVTSIGNSAFYNCTSLASIEIPDSVTSIGNSAFYNCTSLASIEIPDSVTSIGNSAFYNCTSITSIEIPDSVTSIGDYAFYNCRSLRCAVIGNGVTAINQYLFARCSSLKSIEIPNSVTSIRDYAFQDCISLTSIVIPDSVEHAGYGLFDDCRALTIFCEHESQPRVWNYYWNWHGGSVVWGYTGS